MGTLTKPRRTLSTVRAELNARAEQDANPRLAFAIDELRQSATLTGARSRKLSTRVDPGLIDAARRRTGLQSDSDLINAALAVLAAGDDFGAWLVQQKGTLPDDFTLAL